MSTILRCCSTVAGVAVVTASVDAFANVASVTAVAFAASATSAAVLILIIIRKSWSFCRGLFSSCYQVVGQLATEFVLAITYIYRPC